MKSEGKFINTRTFELTLSFTMTLDAWQKFAEALDTSWASSEFRRHIRDHISRASNRIEGPKETMSG